ncbi:SpoIID/LytB domain-containing protein, partial [bacterium]|nr:SpoIID/LytB domain-containing protein [bacterium]
PRAAPAATFLMVALVALLAGGCLAPKRVGPGERPVGPPPAAAPGGPILVRIGLTEGADQLRLGADGPWELAERAHATDVTAHEPAFDVVLERRGEEVAATVDGFTRVAPWLTVAPIDPAHVLRWDDRRWRGELHVIPTPGEAGLTLINVLELESYLAGVVPREIGPGRARRDLAAVAAQAVAARTYTIGRLDAQRARGFDLFADVRDQAYGGVDWEDPLCTEALARTAGLVLRHGERLVPTYYHSTCGGHTASIDEVWPYDADPVLAARPDRRPDGRPWCAESRYATWQTRWAWDELSATLARTLPDYVAYASAGGRQRWERDLFTPAVAGARPDAPGALLDLEVTARTASGRVARLVITTEAGRYVVRGDRTRWVLRPPDGGSSLLRSSWFELRVEAGRSVQARGQGWGHGIGLCQVGAIGRARAGQDFEAILTHYYPGARLERLAAGALP